MKFEVAWEPKQIGDPRIYRFSKDKMLPLVVYQYLLLSAGLLTVLLQPTPKARGLALAPLFVAASAAADGGEGGIARLTAILGCGGKLMSFPPLLLSTAACSQARLAAILKREVRGDRFRFGRHEAQLAAQLSQTN